MVGFTSIYGFRNRFIRPCWPPNPKALILTAVSATGLFAGKSNKIQITILIFKRCISNLRGFTFAILIGFFLLISCNKDTVNPPSSQSTTHEYSLAGQTWLMYQYSDSVSSNILPVSDTLYFTSMDHVTWSDSAATYNLWRDSRYGPGLNFSHTPYGTFGSNYSAMLHLIQLQSNL